MKRTESDKEKTKSNESNITGKSKSKSKSKPKSKPAVKAADDDSDDSGSYSDSYSGSYSGSDSSSESPDIHPTRNEKHRNQTFFGGLPRGRMYAKRGILPYNSIDDDYWGSKCYEADAFRYVPSIKLADILNLLDGVLELNGCYIVLTTNFKSKLDGALVRPGRVTFDLCLTFIKQKEMLDLIHKFIPDYTEQLNTIDTSKLETILDRSPDLCAELKESFQDIGTSESFPTYVLKELLLKIEHRYDCMPCRFETLCQNEEHILDVLNSIITYLGTPIKNNDTNIYS